MTQVAEGEKRRRKKEREEESECIPVAKARCLLLNTVGVATALWADWHDFCMLTAHILD